MKDTVFELTTNIARPASEVFAWHASEGAFARLQPPWERVELLGAHPGVANGSRVRVRNWLGPLHIDWLVEHRDVIPGRQFRDVMLKGPFARWEHEHRFEPLDAQRSRLVDRITYRLPGGATGRLMAGAFTRNKLGQMFAYRHAVTRADLEMLPPVTAPLDVLISGASGLVGRALQPLLQTAGYRVRRLVRRATVSPDEISWEPARGELDPVALAGVQAIVHLSGENVGAGRWTVRRKEAIRRSRVDTTRTLVQALARLPQKPAVLIGASAVGIYGERGEERLTESSEPGTGFLSDVCQAWEGELWPAQALGIRTVALRTGVVMTPAGGALAKMLPAFRLGLGGRLGTGRQWMSWIAMDDLLGIMAHVLRDETCAGAVNAVAPGVVTNAGFTATLGRVLHRPAGLPLPAAVLRGLLGEMADGALLASTRAEPQRLLGSGYVFRFPELETALRHVLGENRP